MAFWGVEVKNGMPVRVEPDDGSIHVSQVALGEVKKDKGNESVSVYVKIGEQKLLLGTLSPEKFPQMPLDLVFEKEFELSHNWKHGSVYFCGYKIIQEDVTSDDSELDSEMEEDLVVAADNVKPESQVKQTNSASEKDNAAKPGSAAAKQMVKIVEPNKDLKTEEDIDDSSDEEDDSDDEDELGEDQLTTANGEDDESDDEDDESDDDNDESDDEDEETPKKAELSKKRSAGSATKTPVPDKKAKVVTTQKTEGKKVAVHIATPHPAKKAPKIPTDSDQKKGQTPNSFACKSCQKTFGSESAVQAHSKAKHGAA